MLRGDKVPGVEDSEEGTSKEVCVVWRLQGELDGILAVTE